MMVDIYVSAISTKVWLGLADESSRETMAQLSKIGGTVIDRGAYVHFCSLTTLSIADPTGAGYAEGQARSLVEDMLNNSLVQLEDTVDLLTRYCKLLSRPYWTRVWILQEIVVSQHVELYCGKERIKFDVLHAAMMYINYMQVYLIINLEGQLMDPDFDRPFAPNWELEAKFKAITANAAEIPQAAVLVPSIRLRYHETSRGHGAVRFNLIQLLARTHVGREATDPRDRVWALLGMAVDAGNLGITANYAATNSCTDVFCNASRAMVASGHVDVLAFSQWTKNDPKMPSWAPDWREMVREPFGRHPWDTPYSAAVSATFSNHAGQPLEVSQLRIHGLLVDSIESLKPQCNKGEKLRLHGNPLEACTYLLDVMNLCKISDDKLKESGEEIYADPSMRERAFERVPVADLYSEGFVRCATIEECHLGHAGVISNFDRYQKRDPTIAGSVTDKLKSYYIMMGKQVERRPFVTMKGFVGLAPKHAEKGDVIVIFPGAKFPYVLRRCTDGMFVLIGEAFVHGLMYGEWAMNDSKIEEFILNSTTRLVLTLQLEEIEAQRELQSGKWLDENAPDYVLEFDDFEAELRKAMLMIEDLKFAHSIEKAVASDAVAIAELEIEELS
ncbi:hypothetical protein IFR05_012941 [Cadophora sp. M221]|nr:hypothetical protein IFR05_012941 [Cadophora sp. M221]